MTLIVKDISGKHVTILDDDSLKTACKQMLDTPSLIHGDNRTLRIVVEIMVAESVPAKRIYIAYQEAVNNAHEKVCHGDFKHVYQDLHDEDTMYKEVIDLIAAIYDIEYDIAKLVMVLANEKRMIRLRNLKFDFDKTF